MPETHQPDVRPGEGRGDVSERGDIHFGGKDSVLSINRLCSV